MEGEMDTERIASIYTHIQVCGEYFQPKSFIPISLRGCRKCLNSEFNVHGHDS